MKNRRRPLNVVVDSSEKRPYTFRRYVESGRVLLLRANLRTGDYSVKGLENLIAVERKSKEDAYGSVAGGRARFLREFVRLSRMRFAAVVVESSILGFFHPPERSRMNPLSAFQTLLGWGVRFGVQVHFAGDRHLAEALTFNLLRHSERYHGERQDKGKRTLLGYPGRR